MSGTPENSGEDGGQDSDEGSGHGSSQEGPRATGNGPWGTVDKGVVDTLDSIGSKNQGGAQRSKKD